MTFDRDEQFLHEKLSADLHPAPVDLWPAVAENLPAKPHRRHLWLCLAAPLLIAAGVAATGAQFTDLRTNPAQALPLTPPPGMLSAMSGSITPCPPTCGPGCRPTTIWKPLKMEHCP